MSHKDSVLRLENYQIESLAVVQNETFNRKLPAHTADITTTATISPHKQNPQKYRLELEIQVKRTPTKEKEFFPYQVAIKGRAFFTVQCPRQKAEHILRLNGAAILYGLLRAQVAQITAQSVHGQFLMPCLNFVEIAKAQKESEEPKQKASKEKVVRRKSKKMVGH
jgi:preprotein translocase subunit SecB